MIALAILLIPTRQKPELLQFLLMQLLLLDLVGLGDPLVGHHDLVQEDVSPRYHDLVALLIVFGFGAELLYHIAVDRLGAQQLGAAGLPDQSENVGLLEHAQRGFHEEQLPGVVVEPAGLRAVHYLGI